MWSRVLRRSSPSALNVWKSRSASTFRALPGALTRGRTHTSLWSTVLSSGGLLGGVAGFAYYRGPEAGFSSTAGREKTFALDPFGARQFDPSNTKASCPIRYDPNQFTETINEYHDKLVAEGKNPLAEGYAPFCKHIFVPNFVGAKVGYMRITPENEHLLRTAYEARTERELAVLARYFPKDKVEAPVATYLDVILYSREQIVIENNATGAPSTHTEPWGIISIKPQLEDYETPMAPITMMRNALPKKEGGSGVSLDPVKYQQSVDFWRDHAIIK